MLYVVAVSVAVSAGLMVIFFMGVAPAQSKAVRARMTDLGLDAKLTHEAAARRSRERNWIRDILRYLGEWIRPHEEVWGHLRRRLVHAGFPEESAVPIFVGIRVALTGVLSIYGLLAGRALDLGPLAPAMALVGGAGGWAIVGFMLSAKITARQKEIQKALPDALDLLVICVEAGLGLNQALVRVAAEMRHVSRLMTAEISQANLEIRAGTPRDRALMGMAERTGVSAVRSLVTILIQTERFGTSVARSLRVHAEGMRTKRRQLAEEAAAKTTIKMVFPLAICIFPALFVVVLGPALIQIFQTLSGLS